MGCSSMSWFHGANAIGYGSVSHTLLKYPLHFGVSIVVILIGNITYIVQGYIIFATGFMVYGLQVLSCRREVQSELVQQVLLFIVQNKRFGMVEVCDFLRSFMYFSIIRKPYSASLSMFLKDLITSMVSMCCSFPLEALPLIKLLVGCLKSFTAVEADVSRNVILIGYAKYRQFSPPSE